MKISGRTFARLYLGISLVACGGAADTPSTSAAPSTPAVVTVSVPGTKVFVGDTLQLTATATDIRGNVVANQQYTWVSSAIATISVSSSGLAAALSPGVAQISASVGSVTGTVAITVAALPVASVTVSPAILNFTTVGATTQLSAALQDPHGGTVSGRAIAWTSSAQGVATVSGLGLVTAVSVGTAIITASSDGIAGTAAVTVVTGFGVSAVSPDTLRAGASATLSLVNVPPGKPSVTIGGVPAPVTSSTPTSVTIAVPSDLGCAAPSTTTITVSIEGATASKSWPVIPSSITTLAVGGIQMAGAELSCLVIGPTSGDYYVVAYNVAPEVGTTASVHYSGSVVGPTIAAANDLVAGAASDALPAPLAVARATELATMARVESERHRGDSIAIANLSATKPFARAGVVTVPTLPVGLDTIVGKTSTVRWRSTGDCNAYAEITGRTVYAGPHMVIVEDATSPLVGTVDAFWRWLGAEFDGRMFGLEQQYLGNVFARDIAGVGKVLVVATRRVNDGGAAGFAGVCDFWPRTSAAASNEMPAAYVNVPLLVADVAWWQTYTAGTLMHEAFHEVHLSERLSRTESVNAYDIAMMGEGTANYAKQIYFRTRCGWTAGANVGFAGITDCERREAASGHPITIMSIFYGEIAGYLGNIETRSPIAAGYWTSQLMLEGAIASSGLDEATTIKAYVTDVSAIGVVNFTKHVGRPLDAIVGDHAAAVMTDGLSGFAPSGRYQLSAWNLRDIFAGLATGSSSAFPVQVHAMQSGTVNATISEIDAGTTAVLRFQPAQIGSLVLRFTAPDGSPKASSIRLGVIRVR